MSSDRTSPIRDGGDKEQKDVATEKDEASRESIPDWRDDKDGAQGLKSKLLDEKSDQESTKESGEKSTSSKLNKDAKQRDTYEKQHNTVAKDDKAITNTTKEVEGKNPDQTASKEATLNWRDEKGGVKGLKATLLEGKAEDEGVIGNEALINAAKETVTKVIEDAKQKVSEDEYSRTAITENKTGIEIKEKGEKDKISPEEEEKAQQKLNWRDDKDGANGLKSTLKDEVVEKEDSNKSVEDKAEIDMMTTFVGSMKIKIHQAKDLEKKDLLQKADPYVVLRFGSQESKSEKVKNSLTPVWNHETTIDLQRASPREIEIQLMDWERIGKDEPMGKILLPVGEAVKNSGKGSFWIDLQDCKSGKILISTEFNGSDAEAVTGGGVKELRDILQSDKEKIESDEKGTSSEPKDQMNQGKAETDANLNRESQITKAEDPVVGTQDPRVQEEEKQQTDIPAGSKKSKKKEKARAKAEAEKAAAAESARVAEEAAAAEAARIAAAEEAARIV